MFTCDERIGLSEKFLNPYFSYYKAYKTKVEIEIKEDKIDVERS